MAENTKITVSISIDKIVVTVPETKIESAKVEDIEKALYTLMYEALSSAEIIVSAEPIVPNSKENGSK